MRAEIKVPVVGESISEGILVAWAVEDGAWVDVDDALFELETDKVTMNVAAQHSGRVSIDVGADATVRIGQVVGHIDTEAKPDAGAAAKAPLAEVPSKPAAQTPPPAPQLAPSKAPERATAPAASSTPKPTAAPAAPRAASDASGDAVLAPSVRRLVAENDLDPSAISGSGKAGRLTKADVLQYLEAGGQTPDAPEPQRASAAVVQAPAKPALTPPAPALATPAPEARPAVASGERQTRQRMTTLRRRIADRLVAAQHQAAILSTFNECDMTNVMAWRKRYKEAFQATHGVGLGFMSFFVKAAVEALRHVPALNAQIDGEEIVQNHFYDIGVAVGTDKGLVVPVIRNADQLGFAGIERAIGDLARRARERSLTLNDLTGGSFTISNGGVYGSLLSTPILNPPQSGILGMHAIKRRPIAVGDAIEIRPMMYLALSYDHRLVDGAEAVTFLKRIVDCIEQPERLALEI